MSWDDQGGVMDERLALLRQHVREVPDFPKAGILFRDITPLLASPRAFGLAIELLAERLRPQRLDHLVAIESRGFLLGGPLALALGVPLQLVRKAGKLPWKTDAVSYALEYGESTLELHQDALGAGGRVAIVDDVLATGGTAAAAVTLVQRQGGQVVEVAFLIELVALGGRRQLGATPCRALLAL
ncbi:MAG: adenine phosphoribosyltransferase [Proteobacteria bacterium]|nr:adenine phosphoribosyltransferase [Pseudomonadota bacterium]